MRGKILGAVAGLVMSSVSFAEATQLTLTNRANANLECAFFMLNGNGAGTVFHWFYIANGGSYTFFAKPGYGAINAFRCESRSPGDNREWGRDGYACVTRDASYVNPIFYANNAQACLQSNGQMLGFTRIYGYGVVNQNILP